MKNFVKDPKIGWNYFEKYLIRGPTDIFERFWKHWLLKYIIFKKKWPIFVAYFGLNGQPEIQVLNRL